MEVGYPILQSSALIFSLASAPIVFLHFLGNAGSLRQSPWPNRVKLSLPLVIAACVALSLTLDEGPKFAPALLVPYLQWLFVYVLYGYFEKAHGRKPVGLFQSLAMEGDFVADRFFFFVGLMALTLVPLWLLLPLAMLVVRMLSPT